MLFNLKSKRTKKLFKSVDNLRDHDILHMKEDEIPKSIFQRTNTNILKGFIDFK